MNPGLFDAVIGHERVLALLADETRRPAHAYLFVGPSGVGKALVARRLAAALLCPEGDSECWRRVLDGVHPDLNLVQPQGRANLTVEQARSVVARAVLAPIESARKVVLIEEAGLMNEEAANALLKTLEEPTPTTVFMLVAESEEALPPTIASRCRTIRFGRVPEDTLSGALVSQLELDVTQAEQVARISGGRPGLALSLATRTEVAEFRKIWLGLPARFSASPGQAFRLAEEVVGAAEPLLKVIRDKAGEDAALEPAQRRAATSLHIGGLEILASFYRDAAAAQFGAGVRNRDVAGQALTSVAPGVALSNADAVLAAVDQLRRHQRPELVFANLFATLGGAD